MTVSVLWVSWHDDILARGYADMGLLERWLDRSAWRVPGALTFEHHEVRGDFPDVDGAVVILPARHHASEADVTRLRAELDRLAYSVVLLCGDEEWVFPWRMIPETDTRRVWTMQPCPGQEDLSWRIPGGWYPWAPSLREYAEQASKRPLDWFFAGQVTHSRREQCVHVLATLRHGALYETDGYLHEAISHDEYLATMASAKVIPCPSGPCTVDTARALEALEAGCVPIVDTQTPRGDEYDYWSLCFGDHPITTVREWSEFPELMRRAVREWPASANPTFAWWQQWKRATAHRLDSDIHAVRGTRPELSAPDDLLTVIVPTSPIPSHPSIEDIETTVCSIREQLPDAEIVIVADGVRPEQDQQYHEYQEYLQRLLWLTNHEWHNVVPLVLPEWGHQANATRAALELVTTPLILFCEHDTPIKGEIDWPGICAVVQSGRANVVRLHHEATVLEPHRHLMLDDEPQDVNGVPLLRSTAWWQRPHVASTRFYRDKVMALFPKSSRTMLEDRLYGVLHCEYADHGEPAWWEWRVFVYAPPGDMQRSYHLDSRDGAEKYPMVF